MSGTWIASRAGPGGERERRRPTAGHRCPAHRARRARQLRGAATGIPAARTAFLTDAKSMSAPSRQMRDLPLIAEAIRTIAVFYDGLVVPGALLLLGFGSGLIVTTYGGWAFLGMPCVAGMVALFAFEFVEGNTVTRFYCRRLRRLSRAQRGRTPGWYSALEACSPCQPRRSDDCGAAPVSSGERGALGIVGACRTADSQGGQQSLGRSGRDDERPHHVVVLVLHDVAVMDIVLRCGHVGRKLEYGPDRREMSRIGLDGILEASFVRRGG